MIRMKFSLDLRVWIKRVMPYWVPEGHQFNTHLADSNFLGLKLKFMWKIPQTFQSYSPLIINSLATCNGVLRLHRIALLLLYFTLWLVLQTCSIPLNNQMLNKKMVTSTFLSFGYFSLSSHWLTMITFVIIYGLVTFIMSSFWQSSENCIYF